jgi:chromate transporter
VGQEPLPEPPDTVAPLRKATMSEIAQVFLMLGVLGFGGPAAHVALMRRWIVQERRWVSEERFLRMFGACNLIPGPSSTELAMFLGYRQGGWPAMLLGGALFILPAMMLMLAIAWAYVRFGSTTLAAAALYGIRPAILAVIAWALKELAVSSLRAIDLAAVGLAVLGLSLLGANPILLLTAAGFAVAVSRGLRSPALPAIGAVSIAAAAIPKSVLLFLLFLKIGATSYGSGYVLLALLHGDFVQGTHWLSNRELFDAIAIGQATPGPVFTTATFLGYVILGLPGALLSTVAIFLPGLLFIPFLDRIVELVERHPTFRAFLQGVSAGVVGLIAYVTVLAATVAVVDPVTLGIAAVSLAVMLRWPLVSAGLVCGGALVGILARGGL